MPERQQSRRPRRIRATTLSVGQALRSHVDLGAGTMFKLDTFSGETLLCLAIPGYGNGPLPQPVTDVTITHLIEWLEGNGFDKVARNIIDHAVTAEATRNKFSSAAEWLTSLPPWDGVMRLDKFWLRYCGVDAIDGLDEQGILDYRRYLEATARCTFIAIVARIMEPGAKVDTVPILEGLQGTFKSSLLRIIAVREEWFSDSMVADLRNKDARAHLNGKLIIELAEMAQVSSSKVETIKSFISAQDDKFRPAYGRRDVMHKRQCCFVGTTNSTDYLIDLTGNRRFWPIRCGVIDLTAAREDIDQIYAEALAYWRQGERHHLATDIEIIAAREQLDRVASDPLEEFIREEFLLPKFMASGGRHGDTVHVRTIEVIEKIESSAAKRDKSLQMRVAGALVKLGGKRMKSWDKSRGSIWSYHFKVPSEVD